MLNASLIDTLASDLAPVSPHETSSNIAAGLVTGGLVTLGLVLAVYGVQPQLDHFAHGAPLLMKSAYGLTLAGIAIAMVLMLARPGAIGRHMWRWLTVPVLGLTALAAFELSHLPMSAWPHTLMGSSWQQCPWRIVALSVPVFAGLCLALRRQAPTDLRAAGAAAGLLSGAVAATAYALACPEASAAFVLLWYSAGIAVSTGVGALLGPKILHW